MARSTIYSTIYRVLARHGMRRLAHTDRTSEVVVRYQRQHPGELVHLDVKKPAACSMDKRQRRPSLLPPA
jgi:hypothetical protein